MDEKDPLASEIAVFSKDPEKKEDKDKPKANGDAKGKGKDDGPEEPDISEEDLQLTAELEMLVERLKESDTSLYLPALESLRTLIKTSTSSMTSVPKPLKFLRPHYHELGEIRDKWSADLKEQRSLLCSILSVLAMTYSDTGKRDTLYYRLISESTEAPGSWGHEYVRHLAAELGEEYNLQFATVSEEEKDGQNGDARSYSSDQLKSLALDIVEFFLKHNAEADAVDLLLEMESIGAIVEKVDDKTWPRVCQYMTSCVPLLVPPDDKAFLQTAAEIYAKHDRYPEALALAVRLNDANLVYKYFSTPTNLVMQKQLAFFLARAQIPLEWVHTPDGADPDESPDPTDQPPEQSEEMLECLGNYKLSTHFRAFGKAVGVEEPRSVEDIYKSHLEPTRSTQNADSARQNLASTFVNAFVNAGFGNDKLMVDAPEGQSWIYKNKDHGMMSATASIGMSMLWESEAGIDHIDKYSYSAEEHIKAGAFLATGILHSGIKTDPDVAFALLEEHVDSQATSLKVAAMNGLGIAYAGSYRRDICDKLMPHVADETNTMEVAAMAALALGFVFVGSADGEIASAILQTLMEREESQLTSEWAVFMGLGLALIFLGAQDAADATIETLRAIEHPLSKSAQILVDICSYAGTGNVLKVQEMLHLCGEHAGKQKSEQSEAEAALVDGETPAQDGEGDVSMTGDSAPGAEAPVPPAQAERQPVEEVDDTPPEPLTHQAVATIGIALIAMGEDVGAEMALRQFQHLMTYGDPIIRKSVPLALGLISASNPQLSILDTLSKYSHDSDLDVAINAILAMGLVGAGTNNARLAQMLRGLAAYYHKEPDCFFMVRIAQGLVHMGKGTIGINPFFNDGQVMSKTAVAGLLSVLVSFTDARSFVLGKHHWMLYWIVTAMYPQFLITLNEITLEEKAVTVRVGQAVNTVGLAGTRSGISGFQTHQTPVRIGTGERAELGTNEYFPYQSVLEGLVVLRKNEGYDAED